MSGFVGEFLVALAVWEYEPWLAFFTFVVVIFAAWYMMWMFQRVVFGRSPGELPDPHDGQLTAEERDMLAHSGGGTRARCPRPGTRHLRLRPRRPDAVSGASQVHDTAVDDGATARGHGIAAGADDTDKSESHGDEAHAAEYPDVTRGELATLLPLAFLTIFFGVYPKPIFAIVQPTFERILAPFLT
jgi:formate hydrogenlyase subunit 3/multisubunit Na+/H+ antiporter MnhD subunit